MKSKYVITEICITCGRCQANCPKDAVYPGPEHYEIDPARCVACGTCAMVCPMKAIQKQPVTEA